MSGLLARRPVLIFDLDGTLVDSIDDLAGSVNRALGALGLRAVRRDELAMMIGDGAAVLMARALAATGGDPADHPRALQLFLDHYQVSSDQNTQPYPGVPETLRALGERGHPMGLCTNKPLAPTLRLLQTLGLTEHFGVVIGGDSLPVRKPDPAPALAALEVLGATPEQATFVGDSAVDVETARAAGMAMVLVSWGYSRGEAGRLVADRRIDHFAALLTLD